MTELIYMANGSDAAKVEEAIKAKFPDAKFSDASDFIHEHRFEVDVNTTKKDFFKFAVRTGFHEHCLGIVIAMHNPTDWIKQGLEELQTNR